MFVDTAGARNLLAKIRADQRVLKAEAVRQQLFGVEEFWITLKEGIDATRLAQVAKVLGCLVSERTTIRGRTPVIGDLLTDGSRYVVLPVNAKFGAVRRFFEWLGLYEPRGVALVKEFLYSRKPTVFVAGGTRGLEILWEYLQAPRS